MTVVDDLAEHAADRVKIALRDVTSLVTDPTDKAKIALMASCQTIGAAAGYLAKAAELRGQTLGKKEAMLAAVDMIREDIISGIEDVEKHDG